MNAPIHVLLEARRERRTPASSHLRAIYLRDSREARCFRGQLDEALPASPLCGFATCSPCRGMGLWQYASDPETRIGKGCCLLSNKPRANLVLSSVRTTSSRSLSATVPFLIWSANLSTHAVHHFSALTHLPMSRTCRCRHPSPRCGRLRGRSAPRMPDLRRYRV